MCVCVCVCVCVHSKTHLVPRVPREKILLTIFFSFVTSWKCLMVVQRTKAFRFPFLYGVLLNGVSRYSYGGSTGYI